MPTASSGIDWTDQTVSILRALWDEGHSTAEIGRRMHTTKNAIVGKAHRLRLPSRQSPIRERLLTRAAPAPRRGPQASTLTTSPPTRAAAPLSQQTALPPSQPMAVPSKTRASSPPFALTLRGCCQWPLGEPGSPDFHLCEAPAVASRPYCEEHCRRAYARPTRVLAVANLSTEGWL